MSCEPLSQYSSTEDLNNCQYDSIKYSQRIRPFYIRFGKLPKTSGSIESLFYSGKIPLRLDFSLNTESYLKRLKRLTGHLDPYLL